MADSAEKAKHTRTARLSLESTQIYDAIKEFLELPLTDDYDIACANFIAKTPLQLIFPLLWLEECQEKTAEAIQKVFSTRFGASLLREKMVVEFILQGIHSQHSFLRLLSLSAFECLQTEEDFVYLSKSPLLPALIGLVQKEDQAEESLKAAGIIKRGCAAFSVFCESFLSNTDLLLDHTGPFSLAALAAECAIFHPRGLSKYRRRGCFGDLVNRLKGEDILIKMNVLKLLEQLCDNDLGYILVTSSKIMSAMLTSLRQYSYEATGCLQLIAKMAQNMKKFSQSGQWHCVTDLPKVLMHCLKEDAPETIQIDAANTIGWICSLPEELPKYEPHAYIVVQWIWQADVARRVSALTMVANMLSLKTDLNTPECQIQRNILEKMNSPKQNGIHFVCELSQRPIDDVRFPAFEFLAELCQQSWGLQFVYSGPGYFEFLTSRMQDTKVGLEWKYSVVQAMIKNPSMKDILSGEHQAQADAYVKQGVVFSPAPAVGIEI